MRQFNCKLYLVSALVIILCYNVLPSSQCGKGFKKSILRSRKYKETCCFRFWGFGRVCKRSCVGYVCHKDSECAFREYCTLSKRCAPKRRPTLPPTTLRLKTTVISTLGASTTPAVRECFQDSECATTEYCCILSYSGPTQRQCKSSCVGNLCSPENADCGRDEDCIDHICQPYTRPTTPTTELPRTTATASSMTTIKTGACDKDSQCAGGNYCCIIDWTRAIEKECKSTCVGNLCYENSDCGLNEICISSHCELPSTRKTTEPPMTTLKINTCAKDSHCASGKYCCIVDWTREIKRECKLSCVGNHCYEDSDCGLNENCKSLRCEPGNAPTVQTVTPTRDTNKCSKDSDCLKGKYCCIVDWSGPGDEQCKSNCEGLLCYQDSDCGLNESCNHDLKCQLTTQPSVGTANPSNDTNGCSRDSDCTTGNYCCIVDWRGPIERKCKSSCVGYLCYEDSDCGLNESCTMGGHCVAP